MNPAWWQSGVIYQIYPRSFQDTDGNGTGDLRGITRRLGHFAWLGVNAVWISPVYPSPMADFGYDISDYCNIDPLFGSLSDMDALIAQAHAIGLKIILDYVPNHTSDRHPWFIESRSSRENARRDWYIWHQAAAGGGPPNNWQSNFGGSGWSFDETSESYYYHSFLPQQPDLNWRNPEVRAAMFDVLRFWMARGVDGFRVDVMWMMIKDDQFRDNPVNPAFAPGQATQNKYLPVYSADRPEMVELAADLRSVVDEYPDRVLIAELYLPVDRLVAYYGTALNGPQLPFNFLLLTLPAWNAAAIAGIITSYEAALPSGAWPNWVLGNHDRPRIASRVGPAQARVATLLLLTLRGTPTIYMGDELGMLDTAIPAGRVRDPAELRQPGIGEGRDPERTPFLWDGGPGAGFTTGTPWLPLGADPPLSAQRDDPGSMVNLYRDLLALRAKHTALIEGAIAGVAADGAVLSFRRTLDDVTLTVFANTADQPVSVQVDGTVLLSTILGRDTESMIGMLQLQANEAIIVN